PDALWQPPRAETGSPCACANPTHAMTSAALTHFAISAGRCSIIALNTCLVSSYAGSPGTNTVPRTADRKSASADSSIILGPSTHRQRHYSPVSHSIPSGRDQLPPPPPARPPLSPCPANGGVSGGRSPSAERHCSARSSQPCCRHEADTPQPLCRLRRDDSLVFDELVSLNRKIGGDRGNDQNIDLGRRHSIRFDLSDNRFTSRQDSLSLNVIRGIIDDQQGHLDLPHRVPHCCFAGVDVPIAQKGLGRGDDESPLPILEKLH